MGVRYFKIEIEDIAKSQKLLPTFKFERPGQCVKSSLC